MHERIEKMRSVCAVGNYSAFTQGLLLQLAARVKPQDVVCSPRRTSCRPFPLAIGHALGGHWVCDAGCRPALGPAITVRDRALKLC